MEDLKKRPLPTQVPRKEFERRLTELRNKLREADAELAVWFDSTSIEYLTGYNHIQTERPVALIVGQKNVKVVVPQLEKKRAKDCGLIDGVYTYFDYPGGKPIEKVATVIKEDGKEKVVADMNGAPGVMGYEGPNLSEFVDVEIQDWVGPMRRTKSDIEIQLMQESARWANLGHRYLADFTESGESPLMVSQRSSMEASQEMMKTLGESYVERTRLDVPVTAGFISGKQTALPHGHSSNRKLEQGDVLITGAGANIDGYSVELERTMFVGEPSEKQRKHFNIMEKAQRIGIQALNPGTKASEVDTAVMNYFSEQGVRDLAQHHTGHSIGLGAHEPPYLDRGNETEIKAGHIYTIEPGIYTDKAGYRHSDTVLVTEKGPELLTYYPRDLESNIIR